MIIKPEAVNPLMWVRKEKIKNEKGYPIQLGSKSAHFFLTDFYQQTAKKIVVRKASQIGVSIGAIITELHAAKYWGINQIHTLPTATDVQAFVPDKVNQLIRMNPVIREGLSGKEVEAIAQKQFGKAFLYFKGTVSKRETFMLTSDRNTYDEVDRSDIQEIANYSSRLEGLTSLRMERWISTPTMPGFGIDRVWEMSDQRHWRFICRKCKTEQHFEWIKNVDLEGETYICSHCGEDIIWEDVLKGDWKARFPEREMVGYWVNQMMCSWIKPKDMIQSYKDCEDGVNDLSLEYFYNHKMGCPYISTDSQIPASLFYKNLSKNEHLETNSCIGVDVQLRELYVCVGNEEGVYGLLVLRDDENYIETDGRDGVSKWDRLAEVMQAYEAMYVVIDGGFMPRDVVKFARENPGKVYVNWYKEDPKKMLIVRFGEDVPFTEKRKEVDEDIKVLSDRNRIIDKTLEDLKKGHIKFFFDQNHNRLKELIEHCNRVYARVAPDRVGTEKREWISTGKDDFLHAMIYYRIALIKQKKDLTNKFF